MVFLASAALVCALVRLAAPHVRSIAAGRELTKPGMDYVEVANKLVPVDGVWSPEEMPLVIAALNGGDQKILEVGKERIDALVRGGCPTCVNCKKPFPHGRPEYCDRCRHKTHPGG